MTVSICKIWNELFRRFHVFNLNRKKKRGKFIKYQKAHAIKFYLISRKRKFVDDVNRMKRKCRFFMLRHFDEVTKKYLKAVKERDEWLENYLKT